MTERSESYLQRLSDDEFDDLFTEIGSEFQSPRVVDWELTGVCPYRCRWCWGPDHAVGAGRYMTTPELTRAMTLFAVTNLNPRFVLTGGEPMTRPDIVDIVDHSCGSVDETVLSTTGDLLIKGDRAEGVWREMARRPHASTVAVPLHAASTAINALVMPRLNDVQVDRSEVVAEVFGRAQSLGVLATLRTTVTGVQTSEDILRIPEELDARGVDLSRVRWKIYQYDPYVGPRTSADIVDKYEISNQRFEDIARAALKEHVTGFEQISIHSIGKSADNYVIVSPNGEVRIVESTVGNLPIESDIRDAGGQKLKITHSPFESMSEIQRLMPLQLWSPDLVDEEDLTELTHFRR